MGRPRIGVMGRGLALASLSFLATSVSALASSDGPGTAPRQSSWSGAASLYAYFVPESGNYVQPTIAADRGTLHLEARYNYENLTTGSVWAGYNISVGEKLLLEITPMLGVVFGQTSGIAPGYRGALDWRELELYSEGEYVFDARERADSFFYSWTELTWSPRDWLRLGLVAQRTIAYETERDIQRGLLLGFGVGRLALTGYVFNPDLDSPTYVMSISGEY